METSELKQFVKKEFLNIPLSDLVSKSPEVLIGVTAEQAKVLKELKISNLYDLGLSDIFQNARYISSINNKNLKPKEGQLPDEMIAAKALSESLNRLRFLEPGLLTGVGDKSGKLLREAFNFKEIQDLAKWAPFIAARLIVNDHLGVVSPSAAIAGSGSKENNTVPVNPQIITVKDDPEAPKELVPTMGEYPVEVVYYDTVVMIDAPKRKDQKLISGRVTLNYDDRTMGYDTPGFGALLTYEQSWFAEGITLGSLIKSIALAPGESTKIAIIDWQRTTAGTTSEDVAQSEKLSNAETQNRAISEIANATAAEMQSGSSQTGSVSSSTNVGVAAGGILPAGILAGGSASESINATQATSVSSSAGQRDVSSGMQQNIDNATQQNSFSSRNKRASVVSELSQKESETITTRTITNYNHMHALTIQYWQVVQAYTTKVKLDRYKRCIFIPMEIIDFDDERLINKFKSILISAAKNQRIKKLLSGANRLTRVTQIAENGSVIFYNNLNE